MRVRKAEAHEADAVGELTLAAYRADGAIDPGSGYAGSLSDGARRHREAELLVAVDGDELLGTVTLCQPGTAYAEIAQPDELEFRMLAVAPAHRGRGVGETLLLAVLDRAAELGKARVVMCTKESMTAAQRLYTRHGFTRLPTRDWHPVPGILLLAYTRDL
ncbi:ribosomal protein S18 acetylase RimI-like enzyme [Crossiella equi]|uniref:Ribosomal protein S18 acetylase RimI-like enzyme n=1 Tax=Crossiella equi TaxID=130796 RepID=A0ABS5AK19_9PSEU|nr:GNAT family N-acetyltransferase [Crossiella equi]MBP2476921.1 ribosomal protein S18 acetylase RimI-like enzyme [Crossiella equi]